MKIEVDVDDVELENDNGIMVPAVQVTCSKCDHTTESFGRSDRSVKRCIMIMKEECPEGQGESNYYSVRE